MFDGFKPTLIHRPRCEPGKRDSRCYCRQYLERQVKSEPYWKDFYQSEAEYHRAMERITARGNLFRKEDQPIKKRID